MTHEEIIEEILHEAYRNGIHAEVLELAKLSKAKERVDQFQEAFNILMSEIGNR